MWKILWSGAARDKGGNIPRRASDKFRYIGDTLLMRRFAQSFMAWSMAWVIIISPILLIRITAAPIVNPPKAVHWAANMVPGTLEQDTKDMQAAGITWARVTFSSATPTDYLDNVVATAKNHGIKILPVVWNTPDKDLGTETDRQNFKSWLAMLVNRYKNDIQTWEIHNEANIAAFWNIPLPSDPAYNDAVHRYVVHLQDAYTTIKSIDPSLSVMIGGLSSWVMEPYMDRLIAEQAYQWFDIMAYHPYADDPAGVINQMNTLKAKMELNRTFAAKPVWVTEIGFMNGDLIGPYPGRVPDERTKAAYLVDTYNRLKDWGISTPIFWYVFSQGDQYQYHTNVNGNSLVRKFPDGTSSYLPAYEALKNLWIAPPDKLAPQISNVVSNNVRSSNATLEWFTTEQSDSQLEYGTSSTYGKTSPLTTNRVLLHSQQLTDLSPDTIYHYRVKSRDSAGNLSISSNFTFRTKSNGYKTPPPTSDFNGDGKTDLAVWRPSNGTWYIRQSGSTELTQQYGTQGDIPVPGDYDADGKTDMAVWRRTSGTWYIRYSKGGESIVGFGTRGDVPVPGDYNVDGKTDMALWRPSNGTWYIRQSGSTELTQQYGTQGDIPVPGDYDADGKTDMAVWRRTSGTWYIRYSKGGESIVGFGTRGDVPVPGDYNVDGKTDMALWRPSNGTWYIRQSGSTELTQQYGTQGDIPVPGDYDADGKTDMAVWRRTSGVWYYGSFVLTWGAADDIPLPLAYSIYSATGPLAVRSTAGN